jgi:hypothetical protein
MYRYIFGTLRVTLLLVATAFPCDATVYGADQLIVCRSDELFMLDLNKTPPEKVWKWKAATRSDLPETMRGRFHTIAECKPVEGGILILIAASSNGAAVIGRRTGVGRSTASFVGAKH